MSSRRCTLQTITWMACEKSTQFCVACLFIWATLDPIWICKVIFSHTTGWAADLPPTIMDIA